MTHPYKDSTGEHWDLDNPNTYVKSWYPDELLAAEGPTLRQRVTHEIGQALYYMTCLHPDVDWGDQRARVVEFGKHFARESREPDRWENATWLRKQLFMILDETENQC